MTRAVYAFSRRMFGTVPTATKVFTARMPAAFGSYFGKAYRLDKKLRLPASTAMLVRQEVSSLNGCAACLYIGRWFILRKSADSAARLDALPEYRTSPLFGDAERAALDFVAELTTDKRVAPETFARLAGHYSEREICDIVWLVASETQSNVANLGLNIGSDGLCELRSAPADRGSSVA